MAKCRANISVKEEKAASKKGGIRKKERREGVICIEISAGASKKKNGGINVAWHQ